MKKSAVTIGAIVLTIMTVPAEARMRAGLLTCEVAPSVSFIIGSEKALNCEYKSVRGWRENYIGQISRGGLDIGFTTSGKLAWAVYAPAKRGPGALTGDYGGASVEATVGGGGGANVLVGGFRRSISLQPISVATQHGLDFAVTISEMELQLVR